jgi:hypothetical protein
LGTWDTKIIKSNYIAKRTTKDIKRGKEKKERCRKNYWCFLPSSPLEMMVTLEDSRKCAGMWSKSGSM